MRILVKIFLLLTPFFLLSCSREIQNSSNFIDISEELSQIKKKASTQINRDVLIKLPTQEKIISEIPIGNKDPFAQSNSISQLISSENLKLVGILSVKNNILALISYKNETGVVRIGDIGGKDTNLLPDGYKTISIDQSKGSVTIKLKKDTHVLNILNKPKYL